MIKNCYKTRFWLKSFFVWMSSYGLSAFSLYYAALFAPNLVFSFTIRYLKIKILDVKCQYFKGKLKIIWIFYHNHVDIKGDKFWCSARHGRISAFVFCQHCRKCLTNAHCTLFHDPIIMSSLPRQKFLQILTIFQINFEKFI
jgi:hypothetical protein